MIKVGGNTYSLLAFLLFIGALVGGMRNDIDVEHTTVVVVIAIYLQIVAMNQAITERKS